jgi:hypothetical protein
VMNLHPVRVLFNIYRMITLWMSRIMQIGG